MRLSRKSLEREVALDQNSVFHQTPVEDLLAKYGLKPGASRPGWWPDDNKFLSERGVLSLGAPGYSGLYIGELVEHYKLKYVLELGCNAASSSIVWGHYLRPQSGMLTTVDSWQHSRYTRFFLDFLTYLFEVDNVDVVEGDLRTLDKDLAMFPSAMDDYDLLYIDADHTLESVQRDFRFQARVRSGGYILFDDYGNSPVTEFVDFHIPQLAGFELVEKKQFVGEEGLGSTRGMERYGMALFQKKYDVGYSGIQRTLGQKIRDWRFLK